MEKNMTCVEENVGYGGRLLPVEGLEILVRKAVVNAFGEVKWRLSGWERNSNSYFTSHIPCFPCVFDASHSGQTGSSTVMTRSLDSFGDGDQRGQPFSLLPAGAAWNCAELTTAAVPAGVYKLSLVKV